jgi:hypothetical protein
MTRALRGGRKGAGRFTVTAFPCDVAVTGGPFATDVALARERRAVVPFGATSAPDIEPHRPGDTMNVIPHCMNLITTDMVAAAVRRQLRQAPARTHTT